MTAEHVGAADYDALRRRVRLLMLLAGSERAGITPIRLRHLHTYAYLSNILAPVWNERVFDGRLLKRQGGPFYPDLQHDLDRLVGLGLVLITDVRHVQEENGQWRLDGAFSLNRELVDAALNAIATSQYFHNIQAFLLEVAYAMSALSDSDFDSLPSEDPTYSDSNVDFGNVVDFAEWREVNFSANAARHFESVSQHPTVDEFLHLYVRHVYRRIHGER